MPRYYRRPRYYLPKKRTQKVMTYFAKSSLAGTQTSTDVIAPSVPVKVTGIRVKGQAYRDAGTISNDGLFQCALIIVREGQSATDITMGTTDGAEFYDRPEDVIAWEIFKAEGFTVGNGGLPHYKWEWNIKTSRNLEIGDSLTMIFKGTATETWGCNGVVQCIAVY